MRARHFTARQVAVMCGMTVDGVRKARQRGKFPHAKRIIRVDGTILYQLPRRDVKEYLLSEHNIDLKEVEGND